MHVLQVLQPPFGGVPAHVRTLVRGLVARGHRVDVVGPRDAALAADLAGSGARVRTADLVGSMFDLGSNARAFAQVARAIGSERYDVVHLHAAKAGAVGRPAGALRGVPVVYSPHSFMYVSQEHRGRRGARARRALTLGIERALAPLTDAIVCVCEYERRLAIDDRVARPRKLRVVYNGVRREPAQPDGWLMDFRGDGPLFGFLANLRDQKGLPVLLDALRLLRDRDALPRVAIVGDGPLEATVRSRISADGLDGRVALRPFSGSVWPHLEAFDAFVLPSLWEAFPIGVLEAMAAGLPVVASAVGGVGEAVANGETGVLVPPRDAGRLAAAIERLAADPREREGMGEAGRARCAERFDPDSMVAAIENVYGEASAPGRLD